MRHPYNIFQKIKLENEDLMDKINFHFENDFKGDENAINKNDLKNAISEFAFYAPQETKKVELLNKEPISESFKKVSRKSKECFELLDD